CCWANVVSGWPRVRANGEWDPDFYGGPKVKEFEQMWSDHFRVKHSVSINSCTSGLMVAVGAIGVEPGDEVIVSPWTMTATATSILVWNAIPVFADIEDETFNLDPVSIEKNITPYTKAIVVTNIFGHAARLNEIMSIAKKHNLKVIEDNAQATNALYHGKYTGTVSDIGVFSLNYHKHIHTGEGGVNVTDDDELAERMQLIRNHAEAVVEGKGVTDLTNMIGFNFRMPEMEAAIGIEQLKKLPLFVEEKIQLAHMLDTGLRDLEGLRVPVVKEHCTHVYYSYPLIVEDKITGVSRDRIFEALSADGVPAFANRYENLHLLPMYQKKIAYGSKGFPWTADFYKGNVSYKKGICPVSESMDYSRFMAIGISLFKFDKQKIQKIINAFHKVWDNLHFLK
ncbi:MAG: DegT/DnrJ/EryC1/StrS family aminotransferase, partial [Bacteroidetes bacterium]|nr:DegT/DnrJ/EryC1/StrS family aminotransferase [Bacteroidota bacterium]